MAQETAEIPLFPLHAVLFPGGPLPLRIFEPRYVEMVSHCLRTDTGFGVSLIREGHEVGEAALTYEVGTIARIVDWTQRKDGLLGITAVGQTRFRLCSAQVRPNQLIVAQVEPLPGDAHEQLPEEYRPLADLLSRILARTEDYYAGIPMRYDDASWVSYRLAELLPVKGSVKQRLLEMDGIDERLQELQTIVEGLRIL